MSGQQRACLECGGIFTVRKDHQKQKFCGMACAIKGKRYRKKDESIIPCTICLRRAGIGHKLIPRLIPIVSGGWIYSAWRSVGFNPTGIPTWKEIQRIIALNNRPEQKPKLWPARPKAIRKKKTTGFDLTGQRFGFCVVVSLAGLLPGKRQGSKALKYYWNCVCDCGAEFRQDTQALRRGNSKSCGCFRRKFNVQRMSRAMRSKYKSDDPTIQEHQRIAKKLRQHMRGTIERLKAKGGSKQGKTVDMIGCSIAMLREHIETQFSPGMTWGNHGTMWEIDHIMPLARFDLTNAGHVRMAARYTNLQPMWKEANHAKSDTLVDHQALLL